MGRGAELHRGIGMRGKAEGEGCLQLLGGTEPTWPSASWCRAWLCPGSDVPAVVRNDAETLFWSIPLPASLAALSADSPFWKVKCSGRVLGRGSYPPAPGRVWEEPAPPHSTPRKSQHPKDIHPESTGRGCHR